jgi:hypothetical protein
MPASWSDPDSDSDVQPLLVNVVVPVQSSYQRIWNTIPARSSRYERILGWQGARCPLLVILAEAYVEGFWLPKIRQQLPSNIRAQVGICLSCTLHDLAAWMACAA